jgi:multisubunit Na+/H+ antiporter MnhG subunit
LLLIVPGLVAAARWSLMAPLIMLDREGVLDALSRSSALVRRETDLYDRTGQTPTVLAIVVLAFALVQVPLAVAGFAVGTHSAWYYLVTFAWSALTAPFAAHVLTTVYYRLADPERPVIAAGVAQWRSVWAGA